MWSWRQLWAARQLRQQPASALRAHGWVQVEQLAGACGNRFQARIWLFGQPTWKFDFVAHDWAPVPGVVSAEVVYADALPWPLMVQTPAGPMVPLAQPQPFRESQRTSGRRR